MIVIKIEKLNEKMKYDAETLFLACGIADRFLQRISFKNSTIKELPSFTYLAAICLLIAAKLNKSN